MGRPLEAARRAAAVGGEIVRLANPRTMAEEKSPGDYVSAVDHESEEAIRRTLEELAPGIPVVGEEGGGEIAARYWLVDPLDGTTNFLHAFPVVGISIALIEDGQPTVGVVHAPYLGETYSAAKGMGALRESRNGIEPLAVSERPPDEAIVATGFPFRRKELVPRHLDVVRAALDRFEDLRRPGAASLDLAWVAAGVFDGFFELNLSSWDVAAGALLVEEAGGRVSDWHGGPDYLSGNILAGSPAVHEALTTITAVGGVTPPTRE